MNILLVGMQFFGKPKTGSEVHLHYLAKELRNHGHYVEIFSSTHRKIDALPSYGFFYQNGIKITYINDGKWIIYNDFITPGAHIYDEFRQACFRQFLNDYKAWDFIHFHHFSPLSCIRIAKDLGYYVIFTMHDYNAVDPTCHLISNKAIWDNPYGLASFSEISAEAFAEEYRFQISLDPKPNKLPKNLSQLIRERILYGVAVLNESIDRIVSNGPYFIHHHLFWGIRVDIACPIILWSRNMSSKKIFTHQKEVHGMGLVNDGIITFGVLDYFARIKGQHFILDQIKRLKAYRGQFKVKFFGRFNDYQLSDKQSISDILRDDPFLMEHIELNVKGYDAGELELICKRVDVVLSGSLVGAGAGTSGVEANFHGVPVICGNLSESLRYFYYYLIGMDIKDAIDELVLKKRSEFNPDPIINYSKIVDNDMFLMEEEVEEVISFYRHTLYDLSSDDNNLADRMIEMMENPQIVVDLKQWMANPQNRKKLYKSSKNTHSEHYLNTIYNL